MSNEKISEREALEQILRLQEESYDGWGYIDRRAVTEICEAADVRIAYEEENSLDAPLLIVRALMARMREHLPDADEAALEQCARMIHRAYGTPPGIMIAKSGEPTPRSGHILIGKTGMSKTQMAQLAIEEMFKAGADRDENDALSAPVFIHTESGQVLQGNHRAKALEYFGKDVSNEMHIYDLKGEFFEAATKPTMIFLQPDNDSK